MFLSARTSASAVPHAPAPRTHALRMDGDGIARPTSPEGPSMEISASLHRPMARIRVAAASSWALRFRYGPALAALVSMASACGPQVYLAIMPGVVNDPA